MKTQNTPVARLGTGYSVIPVFVAACLLAAGCAHRSVVSIKGPLAADPDTQRVRIVMDNGSLVVAGPEQVAEQLAEQGAEQGAPSPEWTYVGGLRRDASSAEGLASLEGVASELTVSMDPDEAGTLVIHCPSAPPGVQGMIAYEGMICIPPTLPVEVAVKHNGHVTLIGRKGPSKVETRRGDLRFEKCQGAIEANTGQGMVIAFDHEGDIDVRSGLGDMQVFVTRPGDQITLSTGKGTVQCHVPEDLSCEVDARAEIGKIGNDFDFEVRKVGEFSAAMTGTRGTGQTRVLLRTAKGHISLIQRKSQ